jgi:tetratricopeptide (TPR) repeat protein
MSIRLNRAQAYIELEWFSEAAADANRVIDSSDAPNEKALFRCGRALYAIERYDEALSHYEKLLAAFSQNREAKIHLAKTKVRLEEQHHGKYDWTAIISEARKGSPRIEAADYIGLIEPSGDGLFKAESNIKAGELLMCCKALTTLYPEDLKGKRGALIYDVTRRVLGQDEGWKMTQAIATKLSNNPLSSKELSPLLNGIEVYGETSDTLNTTLDGRPIIDM